MKSAKGRIGLVIKRLEKRYGKQVSEWWRGRELTDPWELLVATMLSAQSTDAQVDRALPALFKRYPSVNSYVGLKPSDLYPYVKSIGIYRNKAKNIVGAAKYIHQNFGGRVPKSMDSLTQLPGVGRKTANIILANAFGKLEGIAVDTHVAVTSNRLFLFHTKDAAKIEKQLMGFVPRDEWNNINHLLIALGRDVCTARRKYCEDCVLSDICPSSEVKT